MRIISLSIVLFATILVSCNAGSINSKSANPLIVVSDSAITKYQCPMKCENDTSYITKGQCPVCEMDLEKLN